MTRWLSVIPSNLTGPSASKSGSTKSLFSRANGKSNGIDEEAEDGSDDDIMKDERRSVDEADGEEGANDWIDDDLGLDDGGKRDGYKDLREKPKPWEMARGDYSQFLPDSCRQVLVTIAYSLKSYPLAQL